MQLKPVCSVFSLLLLFVTHRAIAQEDIPFSSEQLKGMIWHVDDYLTMLDKHKPKLSVGFKNFYGIDNANSGSFQFALTHKNTAYTVSETIWQHGPAQMSLSSVNIAKQLNKLITLGIRCKSSSLWMPESDAVSRFDADIGFQYILSNRLMLLCQFDNIFSQMNLFDETATRFKSSVRMTPSKHFFIQTGILYNVENEKYIQEIHLVYFIHKRFSAIAGAQNSIEPFNIGVEVDAQACILSFQIQAHSYLGLTSSVGLCSSF